MTVIGSALRMPRVAPCPASRRERTARSNIPTTRHFYRQGYHIEVMFGRLKDWRRIAMRYDRCAHTFLSAIVIAATVIFWINQ
jgi:transposase